jgi:threonine/homoserine/homoserine lactone efflux protein
MIVPQVFKPAAVVWLGLSHLIGMVMSKVVMSIVFFGVVTPIGVVRRMMRKDTLQLRAFRRGRASVMVDRNHTYTPMDLEHPY